MIEIASLHDLDLLKERFDARHINRALKIANGKTARKSRTLISKLVRKKWNVKAKDIAANSSIKRANNGSTDVLLFYQGVRLSLMYFDARSVKNFNGRAITTKRGKGGLFSTAAKRRSKKTGVTIRMRKGKGRENVMGLERFGGKNSENGAFMAQGRRGKSGSGFASGVFNKSSGKQGRGNVQIFVRDNSRRTPLTRLTGPSIPQMISGKAGRGVLENVFKFIGDEHPKEFNHALARIMDGTIK